MIQILGASLAAVALFGAAGLAGSMVGANAESPPQRLKAEDVLGIADSEIASGNDAADPSDASAAELADAAQAKAAAEQHLVDSPFVIKRILPIDGPIKYGEWFWDEEGVPAKGELIVTVDLQARVISVFRDGYEIGAAAVLLGTDEHPTPLGVFPILTKEKDNVSEKYGNAPMPYTLRLTWDGVAVHGSAVENGYASHGCVGTPDDFAAKLFAIARKGDVVIITDGKTVGLGDSLVAG